MHCKVFLRLKSDVNTKLNLLTCVFQLNCLYQILKKDDKEWLIPDRVGRQVGVVCVFNLYLTYDDDS